MDLRVLHITNNYPTSTNPVFGIFVKEQIDSLNEFDVDYSVYFINGREKGKFEYLRSIFRIRTLLRDNSFDIIHCHHALSVTCLILSGRVKKNKVVVSYQNDPQNEYGDLLFRIIKRYSSGIILKNSLAQSKCDKVFVLSNGVDTNIFRPIDRLSACQMINLDPEYTYILFVSSNYLRKQKRYTLFRSVLDILEHKYKVHHIRELVLMNVSREIIPYYFNVSSLHLLTSEFEGSPNSVKEAMACGISVVSTDVGNVRHLLDGVNGSYVSSSDNPEELAKLVLKSLTYKGSLNSREMIHRKRLDIQSVANQLVGIYKTISLKS